MTLHLFNPSHDEALAFGAATYCPGAAARRMSELLWDLPRWWMEDGDEILRLPPDGSLRGAKSPDWPHVERIMPWGWDAHIVRLLQRLGAPEHLLPAAADVERWRRLSSRHTTVLMLRHLRPRIAGDSALQFMIPADSWWCTTSEDLHRTVVGTGGAAFMKAPWSCSGRGVWRCEGTGDVRAFRRAAAILQRQGAVEVEPAYERVADLAMEYECQADGSLRFEGLSFFDTSATGSYQGNMVAPQEEIAARIAGYGICSAPQLQTAQEVVAYALHQVLGGGYCGPLGVDMMLTPHGLHPCVEVNLRMTMGRAAIYKALHSVERQAPATR